MKKSFILAAMACIAMTSCTESEFESTMQQEQAISFLSPVVRPNTRAAEEVGSIYDKGLQFNVFGTWFSGDYTNFAEGKMYIDEATAVNSGNTWYPMNGSNLYYWPKNGTITFSAYSPASNKMKAAAEVSANGLTFNNYVVANDDNEAMEDVLFSERTYNKKASTGSNTPYSGVDIQFRHALSSILFSAKVGDTYAGTQVKIEKISLSNVASQATFNQNLDDANTMTTKLPTITGTSAVEAAWTGHSNKVVYKVDNTEKILENGAEAWYFCTTDGTKPQVYGTDGTNYRKSDLILIPQDLDGVTLTIDYTIKSPDSVELPQQFTKTFTAGDVWKMGYRYIYNISIDFDPITLAPMVSIFTDATETGVEM